MELEQKLCYHSSTVMCVKFSSDGKFLSSSGGDKLVFLYGIPGGTVIAKIDHHNSYVGACAFSRNSKLLVTGSNDKQTAVWKLDSNDTHDLEIESNTNSTSEPFTEQGSDSTVVETASEDLERSPEIEISHASILSEKDEVSLVRVISSAHNLDINDLIFISSQRLVSVSSDKSMKLWSTDSPRSDDPPLKKIDIHKHPMYSVCSNGKLESVLITSALDGSIAFWDLPTLDSLLPPFKSKSKLGIRVCRASNDGRRLITAGDDDGAYVWNIETGTCEQELFVGGHNNTVFMACFVTETGSVAVTGCNDGYLKIWNVEEGKVIGWIEEAHDLGVVCGATRPKATDTIEQEGYSILASGGNDNLIKIWKVFYDDEKFGHCEFVQELNGHGSIIMSISFSPKTGKYLASCSGDKTVRLWNSDSFVCLRILGGMLISFHLIDVGCF
jgi:WD40 repeat protein